MKKKISFRQPVESTQSDIPVRDFYRGIVITKDDRYVKIIEVRPITFLLMTPDEQAQTVRMFQNVLKVSPYRLQITAMTLPASLDSQMEYLHRAMAVETSGNCLLMGREYEARLLKSQKSRVSRRFFISFEYERRDGMFQKPDLNDIARDLNRTASEIASALQQCGNEVINPDPEYANYFTAEILYAILNRKAAEEEPYDDHMNLVYSRYSERARKDDVYIPPAEYLAPKKVSFRDRKYVVVDDLYYTFYYIPSRSYNPRVYAGWLTPYINSWPGVDVNVYLQKIPRGQILPSIRRNIVYSQVDIGSVSSASESMDRSMNSLESATYLKDGLGARQDFYYMSILLTITGSSPEECERKISDLQNSAVQSGIRFKSCIYEEEAAFRSTLPLVRLSPGLYSKSRRNVLTEGAASTYPFTTYQLNDSRGVYFGDDVLTNSLVLLDLFRLSNHNVFMEGTSGAGKTYALSLLATRMRILHIPVYIIAPEKEHEFRRLAAAVGGQFIQLAPGSDTRINIMEIYKRDEKALEETALVDGTMESSSFLTEKVSTLKDFFSLLITDMNSAEKQLLDNAIMETYAQYGITEDNGSLLDPDDPTHTHYRKMPVIGDLVKVLRENPDTRRLADIMSFFTTGSGRSFNGQTNVSLDKEFTVFGLQRMDGSLRSLGLYMAMDFIWAKVREDRFKKKAIYVDEFWALLKDRACADYSMKISKLIRAYQGAFIVATQQLKDILAVSNGEYRPGEAMLGNCATRILMKTERSDAIAVQKILDLTDVEREQITRLNQGEALLMTGPSKLTIHFVASDTEHDLISTESDDQLKLARARREQLRQEGKINADRDEMLVIGGDDVENIEITDE